MRSSLVKFLPTVVNELLQDRCRVFCARHNELQQTCSGSNMGFSGPWVMLRSILMEVLMDSDGLLMATWVGRRE